MATVEMVGRLLVSLAVVLGLMWVVVRRMKKGGTGGTGKGKLVEVIDRTSLSRSASVAVVRVNGQAYVLGVAEHGVTVLGETDLAAALAAKQAAAPARRAGRGAHASTVPVPAAVRAAAPVVPAAAPVRTPDAVPGTAAAAAGPLAGSALSPQTWRQTIESLRDLTTRG